MKKYVLIVKTESYSGITLLVDDDFDEDWDSPILKGVLKDFPIESRRSIIKSEEIDIINEGEDIKVEPEYYLNKEGEVKSLTKWKIYVHSIYYSWIPHILISHIINDSLLFVCYLTIYYPIFPIIFIIKLDKLFV